MEKITSNDVFISDYYSDINYMEVDEVFSEYYSDYNSMESDEEQPGNDQNTIVPFISHSDLHHKLKEMLLHLFVAHTKVSYNPSKDMLNGIAAQALYHAIKDSSIIDISDDKWHQISNITIYKLLELINALYLIEIADITNSTEKISFYANCVSNHRINFDSLKYVVKLSNWFNKLCTAGPSWKCNFTNKHIAQINNDIQRFKLKSIMYDSDDTESDIQEPGSEHGEIFHDINGNASGDDEDNDLKLTDDDKALFIAMLEQHKVSGLNSDIYSKTFGYKKMEGLERFAFNIGLITDVGSEEEGISMKVIKIINYDNFTNNNHFSKQLFFVPSIRAWPMSTTKLNVYYKKDTPKRSEKLDINNQIEHLTIESDSLLNKISQTDYLKLMEILSNSSHVDFSTNIWDRTFSYQVLTTIKELCVQMGLITEKELAVNEFNIEKNLAFKVKAEEEMRRTKEQNAKLELERQNQLQMLKELNAVNEKKEKEILKKQKEIAEHKRQQQLAKMKKEEQFKNQQMMEELKKREKQLQLEEQEAKKKFADSKLLKEQEELKQKHTMEELKKKELLKLKDEEELERMKKFKSLKSAEEKTTMKQQTVDELGQEMKIENLKPKLVNANLLECQDDAATVLETAKQLKIEEETKRLLKRRHEIDLLNKQCGMKIITIPPIGKKKTEIRQEESIERGYVEEELSKQHSVQHRLDMPTKNISDDATVFNGESQRVSYKSERLARRKAAANRTFTKKSIERSEFNIGKQLSFLNVPPKSAFNSITLQDYKKFFNVVRSTGKVDFSYEIWQGIFNNETFLKVKQMATEMGFIRRSELKVQENWVKKHGFKINELETLIPKAISSERKNDKDDVYDTENLDSDNEDEKKEDVSHSRIFITDQFTSKCGLINNQLYVKSNASVATEDDITKTIIKIQNKMKNNYTEGDDVSITYTSDEERDVVYVFPGALAMLESSPNDNINKKLVGDLYQESTKLNGDTSSVPEEESKPLSIDIPVSNLTIDESTFPSMIVNLPSELETTETALTTSPINSFQKSTPREKNKPKTLSGILDTSKSIKKENTIDFQKTPPSNNGPVETNVDNAISNEIQRPSDSKFTTLKNSSLRIVSTAPKTQSKTGERFSENKFSMAFEQNDAEKEIILSSSDEETEEENEVNLTESVLTSKEVQLTNTLEQLSSIFPHIPLKHLQLILEKSNCEIEEATDTCLSYDLLKNELDLQAPSVKWEILDKKNEVFVRKALKKEETELIERLEVTVNRMDKADKIFELLRLENSNLEKVTYFLKRNKDDVYTTVLDILVNWRDDKSLDDQGTRKLHETSLPNQETTGLSYAESLSADLTRNIKHDRLDLVRDNVSSEDWRTLASYIKQNASLKMPSNFYINALVWFNFNVIEVLFLASSLIEEKELNSSKSRGEKISQKQMYQFIGFERLNKFSDDIFGDKEITFEIPKKEVRNQRLHELKSSIAATKLKISNEGNRSVKGHYSSKLSQMHGEVKQLRNYDQDELYFQIESMAEDRDMIDLHSFTVTNAIKLIKDVLPKWWEDELYHRSLNGGGGGGTKATNVNPFNIVTGRGIHSSGDPVILNAVKAYLQSEKWIFQDNTGSFLVVGKRR